MEITEEIRELTVVNAIAAGFELKRGAGIWAGYWAWERNGHCMPVDAPTEECPYPVSESLVVKFGHDSPPCTECGLPVEGRGRKACPTCSYWLQKIANPNKSSVVFQIDSERRGHRVVGSAARPSSSNGYGGSWFTITWLDGRQTETCDLWFQSDDIPQRFWDRIHVNALAVEYGRLRK